MLLRPARQALTFYNGKTDEQVAAIAKLAPLERIGTPDEIAGVVAMLAGPDGRWVNSSHSCKWWICLILKPCELF